jgi:hypothetical protein
MTRLPYDRFCDEVVIQTGLLRAVAAGADLSVTVPTTARWRRPSAPAAPSPSRSDRSPTTAVRPATTRG